MTERRYADADQVVGCQLGQHLGVNIVVAEQLDILTKTDPAQPTIDVQFHSCAC